MVLPAHLQHLDDLVDLVVEVLVRKLEEEKAERSDREAPGVSARGTAPPAAGGVTG